MQEFSEVTINNLISHIPTYVCLIDKEFIIHYLNYTADNITKETMLGTCCLDYVVGPECAALRTMYTKVWVTGEEGQLEVNPIVEGQTMDLYLINAKIHMAEGKRWILVTTSFRLSNTEFKLGVRAFKPNTNGAKVLRDFKSAKKNIVADFECEYIKKAIEDADGNISLASRNSDISRSNFISKMRTHQIGGYAD